MNPLKIKTRLLFLTQSFRRLLVCGSHHKEGNTLMSLLEILFLAM